MSVREYDREFRFILNMVSSVSLMSSFGMLVVKLNG